MTNVVLLMSDEHNPRISSAYGHPFVKTPNMDRLASMGTTYRNAYCPSPVCLASRSAFMAGKPAHQLNTFNNCNVLSGNFESYGERLSAQGVHTVHIGKTDVWESAAGLGFSEMRIPIDRQKPGDTNFVRRPLTSRDENDERASGYGVRENPYAHDDLVMEEALQWLSESAPKIDKPWVLTVNVLAPHFPHFVTQELWDMYPVGGDLPSRDKDCETAQHPYAADLRKHFSTESYSEADIRGLRRGYYGCVTYMDRQLGRLLDKLEAQGTLQDTVVIYCSDHGEMLGEFGMWWKCSLYEDSVRVPLIAAGPGFMKGESVETPVSLWDMQAALFEAAGVSHPADWWGEPLQQIEQASEERVVFSEYHGHGTRSGAFMVRKGPWKLIYNMEAEHQLFHLVNDPDELHNLAGIEPEVLAMLEHELRKLCSPESVNEAAHQYELKQMEAIEAMKQ